METRKMTQLINAIDRKELAIAAAHQAAEATTELLRFAREGEDLNGTFGDVEVVMKLIDATKLAIECMTEADDAQRFSDIYRDLKHELEYWV
jgi:gamma-glutamyl phosphate reductase